ncbi:MAG: TIGR00730 family Rossman fold protein [Bacteroidales bacterium]|nr:TIGR00730 family Rossman fold protein [Bacteroidales bacterium]
MKSVCVFCGSSVGRQPEYSARARNLGKLIAGKHLKLVYGGGNIGLMREVADSVLESGGEVIGVMPRHIVDKEIAHQNITHLYVVNSMHERKAMMADLSDAFIALPGGFGTIDELFEIMTWNQLEIISKPTGLLNIEGYFDHLIKFIGHAVDEKFVRAEHQRNLIIDDDENNLLQRLEQYHPMKAEKWIDRLKLDLI